MMVGHSTIECPAVGILSTIVIKAGSRAEIYIFPNFSCVLCLLFVSAACWMSRGTADTDNIEQFKVLEMPSTRFSEEAAVAS